MVTICLSTVNPLMSRSVSVSLLLSFFFSSDFSFLFFFSYNFIPFFYFSIEIIDPVYLADSSVFENFSQVDFFFKLKTTKLINTALLA